ncbi:MAG: hypothetical protein CRN43_05740 [Candidatus Nephrothrix sp. EaCA]|nr:MAG: hypothetical protein CRN43_05740 [Candidatus Nephrothrix sp. EaCA]
MPISDWGFEEFSKSSINEVPSLSIVLEVPGRSWANSPLTVTEEVSLVCKKGRASAIFVRNREFFFMLKSRPYWKFDGGSEPIA